MKEDRVYLEHIVECIGWVQRFTAAGRDEFMADRKTQSAVLRELQTLAESTQRLSPVLKSRHPDVAWDAISGFRNVLVHGYLGLRLDRVWAIVASDLEGLRVAAEAMLADSDGRAD